MTYPLENEFHKAVCFVHYYIPAPSAVSGICWTDNWRDRCMHYWSLKVLPILAYCDLWTCGSGKHLRSSSPVSTGVTSPFGSNFGYLLCIRSLKIISKCNIYLLTHSYTHAQIDKYHSIQGSLLYAMCETQHTHNIFLAWNISPNTV